MKNFVIGIMVMILAVVLHQHLQIKKVFPAQKNSDDICKTCGKIIKEDGDTYQNDEKDRFCCYDCYKKWDDKQPLDPQYDYICSVCKQKRYKYDGYYFVGDKYTCEDCGKQLKTPCTPDPCEIQQVYDKYIADMNYITEDMRDDFCGRAKNKIARDLTFKNHNLVLISRDMSANSLWLFSCTKCGYHQRGIIGESVIPNYLSKKQVKNLLDLGIIDHYAYREAMKGK